METLLILRYSDQDLKQVSRLVRDNESFVALIGGDLYAIHEYLLSSELSDFSAILDRNVYTRITALARGDIIPERALDDHRWAAAVMAFCQIARIIFQYGSSLQEYASHKGGEAAVSEFELFRRVDNCNPQALIDFADGRTNVLDLASVKDLAPHDSTPTAKRFELPIYDFRINYILALKIVELSLQSGAPEQQMIRFIEWMDNEFMLGSAAFLFANLLFSPSRPKGMLRERSLRSVKNIAWDFALIQHWRRCALTGLEAKKPVMLVSRDKVVKHIATRLVAEDHEQFRAFVTEPWRHLQAKGDAVFRRYWALHEKLEHLTGKRRDFSDEQFNAITLEMEARVSSQIKT